jgi:alkylhydroperoxidase family enzyme
LIGASAAWKLLGIPSTSGVAAVRHAYADRLRALDEDGDPAAFDRLRTARDVALAIARQPQAEAPVALADGEHALSINGLIMPIDGVMRAPLIERPKALATIDTVPSIANTTISRLVERPVGDITAARDLALPSIPPIWSTVVLATEQDDLHVVRRRPDPAPITTAAYQQLIDILMPQGEHSDWALDETELAATDAALGTIAADPRLEEIEYRANTEQWLAAILADAIPRSDLLLHRVAALFGWAERAGRISESLAIRRVMARAGALVFVAAVEHRSHRFHNAWRTLASDGSQGWRPWQASKRKRHALLTHIRQHHPDAEVWLDPYKVGQAEHVVGGPSLSWWSIGLLAVALLRIIATALPSDPGSAPSPGVIADSSPTDAVKGLSQPLTDLDGDLDIALLAIADGFTADRVRVQNPALYSELSGQWQQARIAGVRIEPFTRQIGVYLDGQLRRAIDRASYDAVTAYRRLDLAAVRAARKSGSGDCMALETPTATALMLGEDGERQRRELNARLLLASSPGDAPTGPRTYRVPGKIIDRIMTRTKLPDRRVRAALSGEGDPGEVCAVRDALIEAALAVAPARGLRLLQTM